MFLLNKTSNFLQSLNKGCMHEYSSYRSRVRNNFDFAYFKVNDAGLHVLQDDVEMVCLDSS